MKFPARILIGVSALFACGAAWACGSGALHMETAHAGIYGIGYAAATKVQPQLAGCAIERLRLRNQGKEVPLRVSDANGNGVFDSGDRIDWIAQPLHGTESWFNTFSLLNVYELDAAPGEHARFAATPAGDATAVSAKLQRSIHHEKNRLMMRLKPQQVKRGEQPDLWFWWKLTMIDPASAVMHFDLPDLSTQAGALKLTLAFRGQSAVHAPKAQTKPADHTVTVELNGQTVATLAWSGNQHIVRSVSLPPVSLREYGNTLSLAVPKRVPAWSKAKRPLVDVVMFDYYALTYPLAAQPSALRSAFTTATAGAPRIGGGQPLRLFGSDGRLYLPSRDGDGFRYAAVAAGTRLSPLAPGAQPLTPTGLRVVHDAVDWRTPQHGYDYVMIAYPTLLDATKPLAQYHREYGLNVALISVDTVYDEFSHGIVTPLAIRKLLEYGYQHWPAPRPRYVLLVGDASFDIRSVPPQLKNYSTWTDRVLLRPGRYNVIPAGRYSEVPTSANARNLIPTFQYYGGEGQSASDNGFVDFDAKGIHPRMAIGRFPVIQASAVKGIVDKTLNYLRHPRMGDWRQRVMFITNDKAGFQSQSNQIAAQVGKLGFTANKVYPKQSDKNNIAHEKTILRDLDNGQLLVHFLGHGGRFIWRTGAPDPRKNNDLFTLADVDALKNADHLPMVLSMTCYTAPFDNPTDDSIGERFLRDANGGAVAVFAASWRNVPDPTFSGKLMRSLLEPGERIGDAIVKVKNETHNRDMIGMYNLLGDPALRLQRPQETLRLQQVGFGDAARVRVAVPGRGPFHGSLRVQWLDKDHQVLGTHDYRVDSTRATLPPPPPHAAQVRVYATDPTRDSDAIGALTLAAPPRAGPSWWTRLRLRLRGPVALPPATDRIYGSNFGG